MWSTLNGVAGSLSSAAKAGTGLAKGLLDAAAEEFRENGQVKEKTSPREEPHWNRGPTRRKDVHYTSSEGLGNGLEEASAAALSDVGATRRSSSSRTNGHESRANAGKAVRGSNGQQAGWLSSAGQYIETINHIVVGTPADEELNKLRAQLQRLKTELLEVHAEHAEEQQQLSLMYEQRVQELAAENSRLQSRLAAVGNNSDNDDAEFQRLQHKLKRTESALAEKSKQVERLQAAVTHASDNQADDVGSTQQQLEALAQELKSSKEQLEALTLQHAQTKDDLQKAQQHAKDLEGRTAAFESDKQRLQQLLAEREEQVDELMEELSSGQSGTGALGAQLQQEREQHQQTRVELEAALKEVQQAKAESDSANQALAERDAFWIKELDAERVAGAEKLAKVEADLKAAQDAAAAVQTSSSSQVEDLQKIHKLQEAKEDSERQLAVLTEQLKDVQQEREQLQQRVDELGCLVGSKTEEEATTKLQEQLQLQQAAVLEAKKEKDEVERRYKALLTQAEEEQEQLRQWLDEETNAHTETKAAMEQTSAQSQERVTELEQQIQQLTAVQAAMTSSRDLEHAEQLRAASAEAESAAAALAALQNSHTATLQEVDVLQGQLKAALQQQEQMEAEMESLRTQLRDLSSAQEEASAVRERLNSSSAEAAQQLQVVSAERNEALQQVRKLQSSCVEVEQRLQEAEAERERLVKQVQQLEQLLASEHSSTSERQQELSRQLSEAQMSYESLSAELELLQQRLIRDRESHSTALQERDTFWKSEMAGQARVHAQLEQQVQQLQQQLGRHDNAASTAREELDKMREERDKLAQELVARSSECSQLSAEVSSLQHQLERSQAAAALYSGQEAALDQELMELRTSCARLQAEQAQLQTQNKQLLQQQDQAHRDTERIQLQLEAVRKERDQLQIEVESVRQRCVLLEEMVGSGGAAAEPSVSSGPAPELEELQAQVRELQQSIATAEAEKDRLKQQLQRLKQQMLVEQDEEEEKLAWRVQQEVEVVSQRHQQAEAALRGQLEEVQSALSQLQTQSSQWEALLAAKDAEVENLQAALGELAYETEAHERLSQELRASEMKIEALKSEIMEANNRAVAAAAQQREAVEATQAAEKSAADWRSAHAQLRTECRTLRQALEEAMKRVTVLSSDSSSLVDRRIVVKLLVTYFERGQSKEVLTLMARMLQLTPDEQKIVGLSRGAANKGLLRSVAAAPFALVRNSLGLASTVGAALTSPSARSTVSTADSLADQWVDFLLQQVEQAQAAQGESSGTGAGSRPGSLHTMSGSQRNPFVPPDFAGSSHPSSPALSIARSDIPASPGIIATPTERDNYSHAHSSAFPPRGSGGHYSSAMHHQHDAATAVPSHALPPMPASGSSITSVSSHLSHSIHPDWPQFGAHSHHAHQPVWSSAMGPPPPPPNPSHHNGQLPPHAYLGSSSMYRSGIPPHAMHYNGSSAPTQHAATASPLTTQHSDSATVAPAPTLQHVRHARSQSVGEPLPSMPDTKTDASTLTPPPHPRYPRPGSHDSLVGSTIPQPTGASNPPWPPRISVPPDPLPPSVPHSHSSSPMRPQAVMPSPSQLSSEFTTIDLNSSPQGHILRHAPL